MSVDPVGKKQGRLSHEVRGGGVAQTSALLSSGASGTKACKQRRASRLVLEPAPAPRPIVGEDGAHVVRQFIDLGAWGQARHWSQLPQDVADASTEEQSTYVNEVKFGQIKPMRVAKGGGGPGAGTKAQVLDYSSDQAVTVAQSASATNEPIAGVDPGISVSSSGPSTVPFTVTSSGEQIETLPGPPTTLPLTGDTDPARMACAVNDVAPSVHESGQDWLAAFDRLLQMSEVAPAPMDLPQGITDYASTFEISEPGPVPGMDQLLDWDIDPAVLAAFDEDYGSALSGSLEEQLYGPLMQDRAERDASRTLTLDDADTAQRSALDDANREQEQIIAGVDADGQAQRDLARQRQDEALGDARTRIDSEFATKSQKLRVRSAADQRAIDEEFAIAQRGADEVIEQQEGNADRQRAAVNAQVENNDPFVAFFNDVVQAFEDLFDALISIVNFFFDLARSLIDIIFLALTSVVEALVDTFVAFATALLDAFATFVKEQLIEGIIRGVFPGIADDLLVAVNAIVDVAKGLVKDISEGVGSVFVNIFNGVRDAAKMYVSFYELYATAILSVGKASMTGEWKAIALELMRSTLRIAGIDEEIIDSFIGKVDDTLEIFLADPGAFIDNLLKAVGGGFEQFLDNFGDHMSSGFLEWLSGELGDIDMPDTLDLDGVFNLVLQVLDLTPQDLRDKAVDRLGEPAVYAIEFVWGVIEAGLNDGVEGLLQFMDGKLDELLDMVVNGVTTWVTTTIIKEASLKIATMSTGAGSLLEAVRTAYDSYLWLRDDMRRIIGIVVGVVDSMNEIANGETQGASDKIESVLGNAVPVAINALAKYLRIDGLAEAVRGIIRDLRGLVDQAFDAVVDAVFGLFTGGNEEDTSAPDLKALALSEDPQAIRDGLQQYATYMSAADGNADDDELWALAGPCGDRLIELSQQAVLATTSGDLTDVKASLEQLLSDGVVAQQFGATKEILDETLMTDVSVALQGPMSALLTKAAASSSVSDMFKAIRDVLETLELANMLGIELQGMLDSMVTAAQALVDRIAELAGADDSLLTELAHTAAFASVLGLDMPAAFDSVAGATLSDLPELPDAEATGEPVKFSAAGGSHHVWLQKDADSYTAMIGPNAQRIDSLRTSLSDLQYTLPSSSQASMTQQLIGLNTAAKRATSKADEQGAQAAGPETDELAEATENVADEFVKQMLKIVTISHNVHPIAGLGMLHRAMFDLQTSSAGGLGVKVTQVEYFEGYMLTMHDAMFRTYAYGSDSLGQLDSVMSLCTEAVDTWANNEFLQSAPELSKKRRQVIDILGQIDQAMRAEMLKASGLMKPWDPLHSPSDDAVSQRDEQQNYETKQSSGAPGSDTVIQLSDDVTIHDPPAAEPAVVVPTFPSASSPIYFDNDAPTPRTDEGEKLGALRSFVDARQTAPLVVLGYASTSGADTYNHALSMKRAKSVAESIGAQSPDDTVDGLGESGQDESAESRRVEVRLK